MANGLTKKPGVNRGSGVSDRRRGRVHEIAEAILPRTNTLQLVLFDPPLRLLPAVVSKALANLGELVPTLE